MISLKALSKAGKEIAELLMKQGVDESTALKTAFKETYIPSTDKATAETALTIMSDDNSVLPVLEATRAGAMLSGNEMSPALSRILKQNAKASSGEYSDYPSWIYTDSGLSPKEAMLDVFDHIAAHGPRVPSGPRGHFTFAPKERSRYYTFLNKYGLENSGFTPADVRKMASDQYVARQLLLDAAEGDMDVAATLAQRLGLEKLL